MLRIGDLVQVAVNDRNLNRRGIVVGFLSSGTVEIYIGATRVVYPTAFLRKVESQG